MRRASPDLLDASVLATGRYSEQIDDLQNAGGIEDQHDDEPRLAVLLRGPPERQPFPDQSSDRKGDQQDGDKRILKLGNFHGLSLLFPPASTGECAHILQTLKLT